MIPLCLVQVFHDHFKILLMRGWFAARSFELLRFCRERGELFEIKQGALREGDTENLLSVLKKNKDFSFRNIFSMALELLFLL